MKTRHLRLVLAFIFAFTSSYAFTNESLAVEAKPFTAEHIEEFADSYFINAMEELHIPGTVLIVIKDGEVVFKKGYGYANVEKSDPVDPAQSLFRIGSITKLFTATAIMQLVEQGLLDLEQDVNEYVKDFQIDTGDYSSIKVKHLLTHTAGFEEKTFGMAAKHYKDRVPLREYVVNSQPTVIREPGQYIQYSNYGMGLLGQVIEDVTGLSYEAYIEDNILAPLGMQNTYVVMDEEVEAGQLAREYVFANGEYTELPIYDYNYPPAGSMISTAEDMAKFMQVHLNLGELHGTRILEESTVQMMHERQFSQHPAVQGFGFGFFENLYSQLRLLEHGGNTDGSNSLLMIEKEHNIGVFTSNNSVSGAFLTYYFGKSLIDHFYPNPTLASPILSEKEDSLDRYTGNYHSNRYGHHNITKFILAISPHIKISKSNNESLIVSFLEETLEFKEVSPLVFLNPETNQSIAFEEDERGNITHLFYTDSGVYEKSRWYENTLLHGIIALALLLFSLIIVVSAFVQRIRRLKRGDPKQATVQQKSLRWLRYSGGIVVLLSLLFIVFIALVMTGLVNMLASGGFSFELPIIFKVAFVAPILMTVLAIILALTVLMSWADGSGSLRRKVLVSSYLLLSVSVLLILHYYNWIGFNY